MKQEEDEAGVMQRDTFPTATSCLGSPPALPHPSPQLRASEHLITQSGAEEAATPMSHLPALSWRKMQLLAQGYSQSPWSSRDTARSN